MTTLLARALSLITHLVGWPDLAKAYFLTGQRVQLGRRVRRPFAPVKESGLPLTLSPPTPVAWRATANEKSENLTRPHFGWQYLNSQLYTIARLPLVGVAQGARMMMIQLERTAIL